MLGFGCLNITAGDMELLNSLVKELNLTPEDKQYLQQMREALELSKQEVNTQNSNSNDASSSSSSSSSSNEATEQIVIVDNDSSDDSDSDSDNSDQDHDFDEQMWEALELSKALARSKQEMSDHNSSSSPNNAPSSSSSSSSDAIDKVDNNLNNEPFDEQLKKAIAYSIMEHSIELVERPNNDSISSSSSSSSSSSQHSNQAEKECSICFDDLPVSDFPQLSCGHNSVCVDCLKDQVEIGLKQKTTENLVCSSPKCRKELIAFDIGNIRKNLLQPFLDVKLKEFIVQNKQNMQYCPTPDCAFAFEKDGQRGSVQCPSCKHVYCSHCLFKHPLPQTCDDAKADRELSQDVNKSEQATQKWITQNAAQCLNCTTHIQKNGGCNHMTCNACGNEFCYVCKKNYTFDQGFGNFEKDCACPMFD